MGLDTFVQFTIRPIHICDSQDSRPSMVDRTFGFQEGLTYVTLGFLHIFRTIGLDTVEGEEETRKLPIGDNLHGFGSTEETIFK